MSLRTIALLATFFTLPLSAPAAQSDLEGMNTADFFLRRVPVGCQPKGVKADRNGEYLYVAEMCGKIDAKTKQRFPSISIVDLKTLGLAKTLQTPLGSRVGILANTEVEFTLHEDFALVARAEGDRDVPVYPGQAMISAIDTRSQRIIKHIPVHGAGAKIVARRPLVATEGKREIVYVANYFSDDISVLDVTDLRANGELAGDQHYVGKIRLTTRFPNPKSKTFYKIAPRGVAFTPDGKYAIVLATETGTLMLVDAVRHRLVAELAPIPQDLAGRPVNVRHVVISNDGRLAYLSHMRGNAISRIDVDTFVRAALASTDGRLPGSLWSKLWVPFANGKKLVVLEDYPPDHPNFPNAKWKLAHPNTIVLDPVNNRYLYVSHRTTSNANYEIIDPKIKGKIDIVDTNTGNVVFTLTGGAQPTALDVTPDNGLLISGGFKDDKLYFFDLRKLLDIYEQ